MINNRGYWGFIILIFCCCQLNAQQKKNIEILDSLTADILNEVQEKILVSGTDTISIVIDSAAAGYQNYLLVIVGNYFKEKQFSVFRNNDPSISFDGMTLMINNYLSKIEYSQPHSKKFLGRSFVTRDITLALLGQLLKGKRGEVISILNKSEQYRDEIPASQISDLEMSGYSFTQGQHQEYSYWSALVEPIVAITVITAIIYLFYAQRG